MKHIISELILFSSLLLACKENNHTIIAAPNLKAGVIIEEKPTINVYVENSGSMNGYVKGFTEFEQAVYNYLTDIKISGVSDTVNLFYINSQVIPQGSDIEDFIKRLEPSTFKAMGGNLGTSDISNVMKSIFSETDENEIAILVTDGIFSPGKGKNASEYLVNQQIGIKNTIASYLNMHPSTGIILYQLSSKFEGIYYNREDSRTNICSRRPYYIWVIGDARNLIKLKEDVPQNKFHGGIDNVFSIVACNQRINYAIKLNSGKFELDKKNPKNSMNKLKKDSHSGLTNFSVNCDLSKFLLNDDYLMDISNYLCSNKEFSLSVKKVSANSFGYTHTLNLSTNKVVTKGVLSIKLKAKIPDWVEEVNDDDGLTHIEGKTYGIKYQIIGVYEAFFRTSDFYTDIKINIK